MKLARIAVAAALATAMFSAAASAQVAPGATVYGPDGSVAGTIASVAGGVVTLDTGTYKAPLPENAFGKGDKGPTITVTKAQIDEMMAAQASAANAQRDAALIPGAAVVSPKGAPLGTIKSVEGDAVVLDSPSGAVELKREHFAVNPQGALMALFTAEQVAAAASAGQSGQ